MAFNETLESELHDFAILAAALGGARWGVAAGRSAGALAAAATAGAGIDGAAAAAWHAAGAAPGVFAVVSGPEVAAGLGVAAVAGVHWRAADGALAGGVFVPVPFGEAAGAGAGEALTALGRRLSAQLRLRDELRENARLATTDALTGILNRAGFDAALATEWQRARRAKGPVALLLFDVDGLGQVNAAGGRAAGDAALARVAGCLQSCVSRGGDLVARFSGDTFAVLLAEVNESRTGAAVVAEKCRAAVERLGLKTGEGGVLTVSGGAVTMVPDAAEPARLLQRADSALYMAKDRGGNRVCAFAPRRVEVKEESGAF